LFYYFYKMLKSKTTINSNVNQIPDEILQNSELNSEITRTLPHNYNFEIHKTIWRIRKANAKLVALQFPEGLLLFSCAISDILEKFCDVETIIMGDVTYGACCLDDFSANAAGADFMVHYGHSCLIPVDNCLIANILYIFVEISVDLDHFISTLMSNFPKDVRISLVSTIQFASSLTSSSSKLKEYFTAVEIPQIKPLSHGEVLGCTAPPIKDADIIIYLGDGRFHLEAIMIANPKLKAYRYDPYNQKFTEEVYDHIDMLKSRKEAVDIARQSKSFGIILGTLGRQGSLRILNHLSELMKKKNLRYYTILLSEITSAKLDMFSDDDIDSWIQIACPRLSIDWGYAFKKPLLNPYEAEVALSASDWLDIYPMDYYSTDSKTAGPWTVKYGEKPIDISKKLKQLKMDKL